MVNFCFQLLVIFSPDNPDKIAGKPIVDSLASRAHMSAIVDAFDAKYITDKTFWKLIFPIYSADKSRMRWSK